MKGPLAVMIVVVLVRPPMVVAVMVPGNAVIVAMMIIDAAMVVAVVVADATVVVMPASGLATMSALTTNGLTAVVVMTASGLPTVIALTTNGLTPIVTVVATARPFRTGRGRCGRSALWCLRPPEIDGWPGTIGRSRLVVVLQRVGPPQGGGWYRRRAGLSPTRRAIGTPAGTGHRAGLGRGPRNVHHAVSSIHPRDPCQRLSPGLHQTFRDP